VKYLVQFGDWPDQTAGEFNDVFIVEADSPEQAELKALCHYQEDDVADYSTVEDYRKNWIAKSCLVTLLDDVETIK
jgi:hypothetical protein